MTKKKKGTKVAHISVTSDGVRSGEESTLVVSKGVIKTSATTKVLLESMITQQNRNHKELCDVFVKHAVLQDQQIKKLLEQSITQGEIAELVHQVERRFESERLSERSDTLDLYSEVLTRISRIEGRSVWQRIRDYIFGRKE